MSEREAVKTDVVVVGGGPAGLSAALMLGRSCRSVVLVDNRVYRNASSRAIHGFLTRDGQAPDLVRAEGRRQLGLYGTKIETATVLSAAGSTDGFSVLLPDKLILCRKLILASGITDRLPPLAGLRGFYGRSIFLCPYCDGWEFRGRPLGVLGDGGASLAATLLNWSDDVVFFGTDDASSRLPAGVRHETTPVTGFVGSGGVLEAVVLGDGRKFPRRALFLRLPPPLLSPLVEAFGLVPDGEGVENDETRTCVPGLFVCGDLCRSDLRFAVTAAASGATAAILANREMMVEDGSSLLE